MTITRIYESTSTSLSFSLCSTPSPSFSVPSSFLHLSLPFSPLPSSLSLPLTPHPQWTADSVNDMYADAVLAVILQIESNPKGMEGVCVST